MTGLPQVMFETLILHSLEKCKVTHIHIMNVLFFGKEKMFLMRPSVLKSMTSQRISKHGKEHPEVQIYDEKPDIYSEKVLK